MVVEKKMFDFNKKTCYHLNSVGFPADEQFSLDILLRNIFKTLGAKANSIKLIECLICWERTNPDALVTEQNIGDFCNTHTRLTTAFDGLHTANFIEWNEDTITIRYDVLLHE